MNLWATRCSGSLYLAHLLLLLIVATLSPIQLVNSIDYGVEADIIITGNTV